MIELIHLLSRPEEERERLSVQFLSRLGLPYRQLVSQPADDVPPYPERGTARQYGCFAAHRTALQAARPDYLLVCECDCLVTNGFENRLPQLCDEMRTRGLVLMRIGNDGPAWSHCCLWRQDMLPQVRSLMADDSRWATPDRWIDTTLRPLGIVSSLPGWAIQIPGTSLIYRH